MFDEKLTFSLPRGYELICNKEKDGNTRYEIWYNITTDEDGEKRAEKTYNLRKAQTKKALVGNIDSNFPVQVVGLTSDFSVGMSIDVVGSDSPGRTSTILFKTYTGAAIVEYEETWYIISTLHVGKEDYESRSKAASKIASDLTTVLGFFVIDGEKLKINSIPKSLILEALKKIALIYRH